MLRYLVALSFAATFGVAFPGCSDDTTGENSDTPDATSDASASDLGGSTDADSPTDGGPIAPDMAAEDSGSDASMSEDTGAQPDAGDESDMAGGDIGCASGTTRTVGVEGAIVACARAAETVNQCDAADLCGAGWHLCTGSEYRARYESMEPPAVAAGTFWIASCVRDGADPTAPSDQVCSDCTGVNTGAEEDLGFSCVNNVRISSQQLYVGVRAGSACSFVGTSDAGNDAFWSVQPASTTQSGAFCCID